MIHNTRGHPHLERASAVEDNSDVADAVLVALPLQTGRLVIGDDAAGAAAPNYWQCGRL